MLLMPPIGLAQSPVSNVPLVSICSILQSPLKYRGKLVRVRGEYKHGLRTSCAKPLVTRGIRWGNALNIVTADYYSLDIQASFVTNVEQLANLDIAALTLDKATPPGTYCVEFEGMVRAPQSYFRSDGNVRGGYGHLGIYAAELVVKDVVAYCKQARPGHRCQPCR